MFMLVALLCSSTLLSDCTLVVHNESFVSRVDCRLEAKATIDATTEAVVAASAYCLEVPGLGV